MELINQFSQGKFPLKIILLLILFFIFILGLALVISGIKMASDNKPPKIMSILLGITLIIITVFSAIYVFLFGSNF